MLVSGRDMKLGQLDTEVFTDVDAENISLPLNLPKGLFLGSFIICSVNACSLTRYDELTQSHD